MSKASTCRPRRASQTLLRPSPSATQSTRWPRCHMVGVLAQPGIGLGRRGLVLEHAPRTVEGGTVAGAEIAALPVGRQAGVGRALGHCRGRAAQVRADANRDKRLRPHRARGIARVFGLLVAQRVRIDQVGAGCLQRLQHLRRTAHDPPGLPRHSTVFMPPGGMSPMSTSTAAPMARARSLGAKDETKGTAVATAATPPAAEVAMIQVRRCGIVGLRLRRGRAGYGRSCRVPLPRHCRRKPRA